MKIAFHQSRDFDTKFGKFRELLFLRKCKVALQWMSHISKYFFTTEYQQV
jgi:hypothetical protein